MGRKLAATFVIATSAMVGSARADDGERTVINVVNGYVYVNLGTRDGAHEGDRVEFLEDDVAIGVLSFDMCGEVICRAPLGTGLAGRITRGMPVRIATTKSLPAPKPLPQKEKGDDAVVGPDVLPYREPLPRGYELRRHRFSTAIALGWVGFGVSYGLTLIGGLDSEYSRSATLLVPVVGPLLYLGSVPDGWTHPEPAPFVLSSLVQGISVICLIVGYSGEKRLVRTGSPAATVSLAPIVTRDTAYFGVVGRF